MLQHTLRALTRTPVRIVQHQEQPLRHTKPPEGPGLLAAHLAEDLHKNRGYTAEAAEAIAQRTAKVRTEMQAATMPRTTAATNRRKRMAPLTTADKAIREDKDGKGAGGVVPVKKAEGVSRKMPAVTRAGVLPEARRVQAQPIRRVDVERKKVVKELTPLKARPQRRRLAERLAKQGGLKRRGPTRDILSQTVAKM